MDLFVAVWALALAGMIVVGRWRERERRRRWAGRRPVRRPIGRAWFI